MLIESLDVDLEQESVSPARPHSSLCLALYRTTRQFSTPAIALWPSLRYSGESSVNTIGQLMMGWWMPSEPRLIKVRIIQAESILGRF